MSAGELILTDKLEVMDFAPVVNQSSRMGQSGNSAVIAYGPSLWRLRVRTGYLNQAEARNWSAWLNRRQGRFHTFTAWRLHRINPAGALGTPDGSIGLTVDAGNNQISLTGCGAYVASVGDMVSYRTANNGFYCGEVQAPATASSGNITLSMMPRPLAKHASVAAVRRVQALAEFELTTDLDPFEDYTDRILEFEAIQILR